MVSHDQPQIISKIQGIEHQGITLSNVNGGSRTRLSQLQAYSPKAASEVQRESFKPNIVIEYIFWGREGGTKNEENKEQIGFDPVEVVQLPHFSYYRLKL